LDVSHWSLIQLLRSVVLCSYQLLIPIPMSSLTVF